MVHLANCPFCGAENSTIGIGNGKNQWEQCNLCGARGPEAPFLDIEEAQARWNRRAEVAALQAEVERLRSALNTPELHDFSAGVVSEAQHQRERWGAEHDAGKALHAAKSGDTDKALHHTISTAAALANWHASLLGSTRPIASTRSRRKHCGTATSPVASRASCWARRWSRPRAPSPISTPHSTRWTARGSPCP